MNVIDVRNLSKDYKQHFWTPSRRVLHSVSFQVRRGEIFGFLGPNGSGKSTTIKILFEIIFPTEGEAFLFGKPLGDKTAKAAIGFLPENPYFYEYLTSTQFLKFHGQLMGMDTSVLKRRIPEVLELVGMKGTDNMPLRAFSKGMLQRIGLGQAILHDPDLVILDEPMTGLDPVGRKEVRDLMLHLRDEGKTVFFSTHILSDVETVCHRVAILHKGKLLRSGTLEELISVNTQYVDMIWNGATEGLLNILSRRQLKWERSGDSLYMKFEPLAAESPNQFQERMNQFVAEALATGSRLTTLSPKRESLEDIFLKQIGPSESRV